MKTKTIIGGASCAFTLIAFAIGLVLSGRKARKGAPPAQP